MTYMEDDDPPPPPPSGTTAPVNVTVQVDAYQLSDISNAVVERIAALAQQKLGKELHKLVEDLCRQTVQQQAEQAIGQQLDAVLAEGFQRTNQWGGAEGPRKTLRELVIDKLAQTERVGQYPNQREVPSLQLWVGQRVEQLLEKEFAKEVAEARERFRKLMDSSLEKKLSEALRQVLR